MAAITTYGFDGDKYNSSDADICVTLTEQIESWIVGTALPNVLMVSFDVKDSDFNAYIQSQGINELYLDIYWQPNNLSEITFIETVDLTAYIAGSPISIWTHAITNANLEDGKYYVKIRFNDAGCSDLIEIPLVTDEIEEVVTTIIPPIFECGDTYELVELEPDDVKTTLNVGEVINFYGFPILVSEVSSSGDVHSGMGIIPLPFENTQVEVTFSGVGINSSNQARSGSAQSLPVDISQYIDFALNPPPLNIGGDICLPDPPPPGETADGHDEITGLDPYGFDSTGINVHTHTMYDTLGYDEDGIHMTTMTLFNKCGCSREGFNMDMPSQACEPSDPCDPSQASIDYADSIAEELPMDVTHSITFLLNQFQLKLDEVDCGGIRTEMDGLISTVMTGGGGDMTYMIKGQDSEFFDPGMHLNFSSRPSLPEVNIDRLQAAQDLEQKHIDLYDCDKQEYGYKIITDRLNEYMTEDGLATLTEHILGLIAAWTEYELGTLSTDMDAFNAWVQEQVTLYIQMQTDLDASYFICEVAKPYNPFQQQIESAFKDAFQFTINDHYNSTADISDIHVTKNYDKARFQEAKFEFDQGFTEVLGVHRAYYLKEVSEKSQSLGSTGNAPVIFTMTPEGSNFDVTFYMENFTFSPSGFSMDVYLLLKEPSSGQSVVFEAQGVSFDPTGVHVGKLFLKSDVVIRLSNRAMLLINGSDDMTFVEWDCHGFVSASVDMAIEFCRNFITPLTPGTLEPVMPEDKRFRLEIGIKEITKWLEFELHVTGSDQFALTKFPDISWVLDDVYVDLSSTISPVGIDILKGYMNEHFDEASNMLLPEWKGFYIGELSATFPNDFSSSNGPITAGVTDVIIDGSGFTGEIFAPALVTIDVGNLDGWAFSIDKFNLKIINNHWGGAGMEGLVNVPLFTENFVYEADIYSNGVYEFTVTPTSNLTADLFLATAVIYESSGILVTRDDDGFYAAATLNGEFIIHGGDQINLTLPKITFTGLQVSNRPNYVGMTDNGSWGTSGSGLSAQFGGFGISVENPTPYNPGEGKFGVAITVSVNLSDEIDINAKGDFKIEGLLTSDENGRQKWVFDDFYLDRLALGGNIPGLADIDGFVDWYDEDPYGKGFHGGLSIEVEGFGLKLQASGQFGKINNDKYFFVDALLETGAASMATGPLTLKGFGGGVANHMDVDQSMVSMTGTIPTTPTLGQSYSGAVYTPNSSAGLFLRAAAYIAFADNDNLINGSVSISAHFSEGGSFDSLKVQGSAQMLTEIKLDIIPDFVPNALSPPASVDAALSAYIDLTFNFAETSFHGTINTFLDAGILKGAGTNNALFNATVHFDPSEWYILIGTPGSPVGIALTLPLVGRLEVGAYFDAGNSEEVPGMPRLPDIVSALTNSDYPEANRDATKGGFGLIFGAKFDFELEASTPGGVLSGKVEAGAGLDILVKKFNDLRCVDEEELVGINGWFAIGQIWAFLRAQIKFLGIPIVGAGVATTLRAELPNPFFASTSVGIEINLLFLKIKKNITISIGEHCELVSDDIADQIGIQLIESFTPNDGATEVETYERPFATFIVDIRLGVEDRDFNDPELTSYYTISEGPTEILADGVSLGHRSVLGSDGMSLELIPYQILPANTEITSTVTLIVYKDGFFLGEEIRTITFTTGDALDYIPEVNVAASNPINGMYNYYAGDNPNSKGFLKLVSAQPDLLTEPPDGEDFKVKISSSGGGDQEIDFTYDPLSNQINFTIPASMFANETLYRLELLSKQKEGSAGENSDGDNILYSMYFRTSKFNKFMDKIKAIDDGPLILNGSTKVISTVEHFDALERYGNEKYDPLISRNHTVTGTFFQEIERSVQELASIASSIGCGCEEAFATQLVNDVIVEDLMIIETYTGANIIRVSKSDYDNGSINTEDFREQVVRFNLAYTADLLSDAKDDLIICLDEACRSPNCDILQLAPTGGSQLQAAFGSSAATSLPDDCEVYRWEIENVPNAKGTLRAVNHMKYTVPHGQSSYGDIILIRDF